MDPITGLIGTVLVGVLGAFIWALIESPVMALVGMIGAGMAWVLAKIRRK